jgi:ABC-type nitrate/sulfonate/bicarbonate transport system ATPase subunit
VSSAPPPLQIEAVSKGYERGGRYLVVLDNVSLEVAAGEVVAVVGRRLGGKSTLLQIAVGLEEPDAGTVTIAGRPVRAQRRRSVGEWWAARRSGNHDPALGHDVVFVSRDGPNQDLDVCQFVGGPLAVSGAGRRDVQTLAGQALKRVGASDCAGRRWGELSNYQRALVGLARAFAGRPQLVILDDLLDAHGRRDTARLSDILHTLLEDAKRPCGVLLSAGYPETALVLANRVCALTQKGTLVHGSGPRPDVSAGTVVPLHQTADGHGG